MEMENGIERPRTQCLSTPRRGVEGEGEGEGSTEFACKLQHCLTGYAREECKGMT
jgi:hypothetical protein